ncbi:hypothetical protein [Calidithermus roseus]|uniref:Uncharacterized protein n=1 Tax=Calidithermus roseus TaxID=1644118 RepID=A0A399EXY2_9DEIN|nr:hypothetical protein [Calidithermus roseus]RIH89434.1 hypothetical protein Mrose_00334 [Calidithermus roseus]
MNLYPTIVAASGELGDRALRVLSPLWRQRLGPAWPALEVLEDQGLGPLEAGLGRLLDHQRVVDLQLSGHFLSQALNLVWVAQAHHPKLRSDLSRLADKPQGLLFGGRELRVHLVLLLPDLFALSQEEKAQAQENLDYLRPDPSALPATRVWPLSLRNRADLHLRSPEQVFPLIQHLVEACVRSQFPFHPAQAKGRDWAGLGVCRLEVAPPSKYVLAAQLWPVLCQTSMGSLVLPKPPPIPKPEPQQVLPEPPKRTNCLQHPDWEIDQPWETARIRLRDSYRLQVDELAFAFEPALPWEVAREALLLGLPALEQLEAQLAHALGETNDALKAALEPFDELFGLRDRRDRLKRLELRAEAGRPIPEEELEQLRGRLAELDALLEGPQIEELLARDPVAKGATQQLQQARARFEDNRKHWREQLEQPRPQEPRPPFWRRMIGLFWPSLRPRSLGVDAEELSRVRKRLCDAAWTELGAGHAQHQLLTQQQQLWLERWAKYRLIRVYRDALARERERCQTIRRLVAEFKLPAAGPPTRHPLVLRFEPPYIVPQTELEHRSKQLIQEGILELFWDRDLQGLEDRLLLEGERMAADLPLPDISELMDSEAWGAATLASAPRVMACHRPDHEAHGFLLGAVRPTRWLEPLTQQAEWLPGEGVLFRFVHPLAPDQIILADYGGMEPTSSPPPKVPSPAAHSLDERPNPLLEAIFDE